MNDPRLDFSNDVSYDHLRVDYSIETEIAQKYGRLPGAAIPILTANALGVKHSVYKKQLRQQERQEKKNKAKKNRR